MLVKNLQNRLFVSCVTVLLSASQSIAYAEFGTRGSIDLKSTYQGTSPPPIIFEPTQLENNRLVVSRPYIGQPSINQPNSNQPGISFKDWAAPIDPPSNPNGATLVFIRDTTTGEMETYKGGVKPGVNIIRPKEKYKTPQPVPASFSLNNSLAKVADVPQSTPRTQTKPRFVAGTYPGFRSLNRTPTQQFQNKTQQVNKPIHVAKIAPDSLVLAPRNYSIIFSKNTSALKPQVMKQIAGIAHEVKKDKDARLEIQSYATGPEGRRVALTRALTVRKHLLVAGINSNRILIKTRLNSSAEDKADRLDIRLIN